MKKMNLTNFAEFYYHFQYKNDSASHQTLRYVSGGTCVQNAELNNKRSSFFQFLVASNVLFPNANTNRTTSVKLVLLGAYTFIKNCNQLEVF